MTVPLVGLCIVPSVFCETFFVYYGSVMRCFQKNGKRWRADTGAERSLSTPQPTLEMIKACYPYFAHGRSKKGEVVVYERTGMMQFGKLAEAGVTPFDMQVRLVGCLMGWLIRFWLVCY